MPKLFVSPHQSQDLPELRHQPAFTAGSAAAQCLSANPYSTIGNTKKRGMNEQAAIERDQTKKLKTDGRYWCTICAVPHSYQNCDDWKKHEKEHEINFVCGVGQSIQGGSSVCMLCGFANPDRSHHESHTSSPCVNTTGEPPSFKRRYDMMAHLAQRHGVLDSKSLADQYRRTFSKQTWSCGFCLFSFSTLADRLRHIDVEHFRKNEHIKAWSTTKIINGLLLQREVREAWKILLASVNLDHSGFSWHRNNVQDLQLKLELGPNVEQSAESLAQAAYDHADYDWSAFQSSIPDGTFNITVPYGSYSAYSTPSGYQFDEISSYPSILPPTSIASPSFGQTAMRMR